MVSRACPTGLLCFEGLRKSTGKSKLSISSGCVGFLPVVLFTLGCAQPTGSASHSSTFQDGENPSTYFSYFWVELEDPSRYSDAATTVLQIPIPQIQRKRPGGIGIADIQPFLRPSLQAQQEAHEWTGVTERMVDEVDESKRAVKVYDLRIEPSCKCLLFVGSWASSSHSTFTSSPVDITAKRPQRIGPSKPHLLTQAFVKWGGFAPSLPQGPGTTGPSVRPTFDNLVKRATQSNKPEQKTVITGDEIPSPVEEPHKPFNYEFDEPAPSAEVWTPASSQANTDSSAKPQSLLTMQREGKQLSKKQKALLQAAAISRTPLPSFEAKTLSEAEKDGREATKSEATPESTDEEKKEIQNRVWDLVKGKWF